MTKGRLGKGLNHGPNTDREDLLVWLTKAVAEINSSSSSFSSSSFSSSSSSSSSSYNVDDEPLDTVILSLNTPL
jgi:hypothetical protein